MISSRRHTTARRHCVTSYGAAIVTRVGYYIVNVDNTDTMTMDIVIGMVGVIVVIIAPAPRRLRLR